MDHFVRYRFCEYDKHIGAAYLVSEIGRELSEYLTFAAVFFAYAFVAAVHPVMPSDYNNAHD